jgi:hypothetical protein
MKAALCIISFIIAAIVVALIIEGIKFERCLRGVLKAIEREREREQRSLRL